MYNRGVKREGGGSQRTVALSHEQSTRTPPLDATADHTPGASDVERTILSSSKAKSVSESHKERNANPVVSSAV
jgi:hypothetical protein